MAVKPKVLVLDAQMRSSLAIIRALGKIGYQVDVAEETRFATGFFSKYCNKRYIYPSPKNDKTAFIERLVDILRKENYGLLYAVTDQSIMPIVENKVLLEEFVCVPFPNENIFRLGYEKAKTLKIAQKKGLSIPKTTIVNIIDDLKFNEISFPCIIKPSISSGSRGLQICCSREELVLKVKNSLQIYGSMLVQEMIPDGGEQIGVYTILDFKSTPVALTVQRRVRSYPVNGGPSTLRETIERPQLVKEAMSLLKEMNWYGAAMVEYKVDPRDGKPKLMEVNPRFWGSLNLSILSGVNFPHLLFQLFNKVSIYPNLNYKSNVRCRWLLPGDILWFLSTPCKRNTKPFKLSYSNGIFKYGTVFIFLCQIIK